MKIVNMSMVTKLSKFIFHTFNGRINVFNKIVSMRFLPPDHIYSAYTDSVFVYLNPSKIVDEGKTYWLENLIFIIAHELSHADQIISNTDPEYLNILEIAANRKAADYIINNFDQIQYAITCSGFCVNSKLSLNFFETKQLAVFHMTFGKILPNTFHTDYESVYLEKLKLLLKDNKNIVDDIFVYKNTKPITIEVISPEKEIFTLFSNFGYNINTQLFNKLLIKSDTEKNVSITKKGNTFVVKIELQ